eukprot:5617261-Pleurochrysis_carterae.AAC.2
MHAAPLRSRVQRMISWSSDTLARYGCGASWPDPASSPAGAWARRGLGLCLSVRSGLRIVPVLARVVGKCGVACRRRPISTRVHVQARAAAALRGPCLNDTRPAALPVAAPTNSVVPVPLSGKCGRRAQGVLADAACGARPDSGQIRRGLGASNGGRPAARTVC